LPSGCIGLHRRHCQPQCGQLNRADGTTRPAQRGLGCSACSGTAATVSANSCRAEPARWTLHERRWRLLVCLLVRPRLCHAPVPKNKQPTVVDRFSLGQHGCADQRQDTVYKLGRACRFHSEVAWRYSKACFTLQCLTLPASRAAINCSGSIAIDPGGYRCICDRHLFLASSIAATTCALTSRCDVSHQRLARARVEVAVRNAWLGRYPRDSCTTQRFDSYRAIPALPATGARRFSSGSC
jgi:hypothetical protein